MPTEEKRVAVLIDADNISYRYVKTILDEASAFGIVNVKRIYGDWGKTQLKSWAEVLLPNSIRQIQQPNYTVGKNSTDSAMIIDAMDLFYSGTVDCFCLVSSDSDFTGLAMRLKESGMFIVGMGMKITPEPMIASCNAFKFLDVIDTDTGPEESKNSGKGVERKSLSKSSAISKTEKELIKIISEIINLNSDDEGWMALSGIQPHIVKRKPEFDVRNYGFSKMLPLVERLNAFDVRKEKEVTNTQNKNAHIVYIKNK